MCRLRARRSNFSKSCGLRLPEKLWLVARGEQEARELDNPFYDRLLSELRDEEGILFQQDAWDILGISRPLPSDYEKLRAAMTRLGFVQRRRILNGVRQPAFVKWPAHKGNAPRLDIDREGEPDMIENCTELPE